MLTSFFYFLIFKMALLSELKMKHDLSGVVNKGIVLYVFSFDRFHH